MLILLRFLFLRKDEKPNDINECIVKSDRLLDKPPDPPQPLRRTEVAFAKWRSGDRSPLKAHPLASM